MYFDYPGRLGRGRNNGGSLYVIFFIILYCNQVSGVILLIFFFFFIQNKILHPKYCALPRCFRWASSHIL